MPQQYAKKYPPIVPAAKLARLAVAKKCQGQGLGTHLMINAIERILVVSEHLGIIGFFVDAKDDAARRFYEQFGVIPMSDPLHLFLPVKTLREAFGQAVSTESPLS
jgi:GNAT superfamily N-acetyltransferase